MSQRHHQPSHGKTCDRGRVAIDLHGPTLRHVPKVIAPRVSLPRPPVTVRLSKDLREAAQRASKILVVELSMGQMIEDVQMYLGPDRKLSFFGRGGGIVCSPEEVVTVAQRALAGEIVDLVGSPDAL